MRLNLYSLQLFVAVVEEGTIAAAAEREFIATSALSKRMSELECAVSTPLLIRQARGVLPTAAGQILARGARKLLHDAEDLSMEVRDFAIGLFGHVRLAANLSAITQFLPGELRHFSHAHPKIQIDLEERVSSVVTRMVLDNTVDIGIFARSDDEHLLKTFPYREDCVVLVTRHDHPLAQRPSLAFADTLEFDHVGMHRGGSGNHLLVRAASDANGILKTRFHVTSFDALVSMIKAGLGIGVVPRNVIALYATEGLSMIELEDAWARRRLKIGVRSEEGLTTAARTFLAHLQSTTQAQDAALHCAPSCAPPNDIASSRE